MPHAFRHPDPVSRDFPGYLGESLLKRAIARWPGRRAAAQHPRLVEEQTQSVDDRPFGGGPGMVMMVDAGGRMRRGRAASEAAEAGPPGHADAARTTARPAGGRALGRQERIVLLCGRYEGFDERIREILQPDEDFPRRLRPQRRRSRGDGDHRRGHPAGAGRVGRRRQQQRRFLLRDGRLLEFAQYTRPREYRGLEVPEILLSGNHEQIARWRRQNSRSAPSSGVPICSESRTRARIRNAKTDCTYASTVLSA